MTDATDVDPREAADRSLEDAREQERLIEVRSYEIWEHEGRPDGRALEHWLRARKELSLGAEADLDLRRTEAEITSLSESD